MPLKVAKRIPIQPARAKPAAKTKAVPKAFGVQGEIMLDVPYVQQEQNEWCWAACTQMVAAYLGQPDVKQCELANFLHGQTDCCQNPGSDQCNQPAPLEKVVPVYNHLNIHAIGEAHAETIAVMVRELNAKRPVEVGFLWYGGGGHVVIVRGLDEDGNFAVHDPWFGSGPVTYLGLLTAYGQGRWGVSYGDFR
jgi:hypothetical protein